MIKIGEKIPNLILRLKLDKIEEKLSHEIFAIQKVGLFGLPGAFTPTCSAKHLPGYISFLEQILLVQETTVVPKTAPRRRAEVPGRG